MLEFTTRFLLCNLFIATLIIVILGIKPVLKKYLSGRSQYNLWFIILALLAVPFIPFHLPDIWQVFHFMDGMKSVFKTGISEIGKFDPSMAYANTDGWANDFSISISKETPSFWGFLLCSIWFLGMIVMLIFVIRSAWRLNNLKKSALPLQNQRLYALFHECKVQLNINKEISIYNTARLKSPATFGVLYPQIYLPVHLLSDLKEDDIRYILMHELQHCKYKDAIPNYLATIVGILYWFNPVVWYGLKEMRSDREIACDCAVLQYLPEHDYESYGNTLINFAEKISLSPFPFASGLSGNARQLKKRIINIASYQPSTFKKRIYSICIYSLIATLLFCIAPMLSTYAAVQDYYSFNETNKDITYTNLSSHFQEYKGSFVLYDATNNTWSIYNKNLATLRVAPNSTYKIYLGLVGLDYKIITPDDSQMIWDGKNQPFPEWNADHTLNSAMKNSVNWYFKNIEDSVGTNAVQSYMKEIGYGNEDFSGDSFYWIESSLKISPIEQVELLKDFNTNQLSSDLINNNTIKNSILLSSGDNGSLYGKTGTGRVNGQDINGWFIGYIEKQDHTYYFATNIQGDSNATGKNATNISLSILSDLQLWN